VYGISVTDNGLLDVGLIVALAAALPSNSTLRDLSLMGASISDNAPMSQVFLALGMNTGLKILKVYIFGSWVCSEG
jgi:hypothetical protein